MGAVGMVLVWLGFAGGLAAFAFVAATPIDPTPVPTWARVAVIAGSGCVIATLWLPWLLGASSIDGSRLELTGWEGLDPLSVGAVVLVLATAVAVSLGVGRSRRGERSSAYPRAAVVTALFASVSALVVGNLLVRLGDSAGPSVASGFVVGAVVAQVPLVGAAAAWRARVGHER